MVHKMNPFIIIALYKNGSIPVKKIAEQLGISKTTLYLYLRYRNVDIGVMPKPIEVVAS